VARSTKKGNIASPWHYDAVTTARRDRWMRDRLRRCALAFRPSLQRSSASCRQPDALERGDWRRGCEPGSLPFNFGRGSARGHLQKRANNRSSEAQVQGQGSARDFTAGSERVVVRGYRSAKLTFGVTAFAVQHPHGDEPGSC
jgi:hypothetical protein